jgi:hypothetical protein
MTLQSKKAAPVTGGAPPAENSKNTLVTEGLPLRRGKLSDDVVPLLWHHKGDEEA